MTRSVGKRSSPISLRLTQEERDKLSKMAGNIPVSTYIKSVVLEDGRTRKTLSADRVLLAQLLGQLGASGLGPSLALMAEAADSGSLHVDDLLAARLHDACRDVRGMHLLLMTALGKKQPDSPSHEERLTVEFIRAATDTRVIE